MEKRQTTVELLGTSLRVQSGESAEHMARVISCLRAQVEEVKDRYSFADPLTVALLAALNLADKLVHEQEGRGVPLPDPELDRAAQRLIDSMDETLLSHTPYAGEEGGPRQAGREPPAGSPGIPAREE
jgi:hypothetical protein